ncbi:MAG TPA: vitamin K epoxide reductase family protein [Candidatus Limnocylindrales bacterium]|jgi:uncharacterized membrane protein|nr:vitamin K epoxide reductase family protein [Candidatus Limnocylindrales bacterium]
MVGIQGGGRGWLSGGPLGWLRESGAWMVTLALASLLVALYLSYVKLAGEAPSCAFIGGCDRVSASPYAELLGIPVAVFGVLGSGLILAAAAGWWLRGSRVALVVAYLLGLASLPVLAYLTYLELFVIHAICIWCVAYAMLLIGGWIVASVALFRSRAGAMGQD